MSTPPTSVSFREALWTWCRVAALSFGGPTAQIAVMHRILVEEKKWISEQRFLHALNYCMLLPGPEAQQLATYIGWLLHGTLGGLTAGTLFILPGFVSILVLSIVYAEYQQTVAVTALLFGLKPAVMAVVVEAVIRIGKRVLKNGAMLAIAGAAFVAIFFFEVPFPLIIVSAGVVGLIGGWVRPDWFHVIKGHGQEPAAAEHVVDARAQTTQVSLVRQLLVALVWLALWFGPIALLAWWFGPESVFVTEATFFSRAAVVTFGGAYAVLPYISQAAVEEFGWLEAPEMLDGLGMAESTPGPLIMVVQFVGFLGAYRNHGPLSPLGAGILGSVVTVWVTFVPCFLYIFVGAPYIERLRTNRLLSCALSTITAAVVGVVLNLAIWFAIKTLFAEAGEARYAPLHVRWFWPDVATLSWGGLLIALVSAVVLFRLKWGLFAALGSGVFLGFVWYVAGLR
ncbi:MAG: chromate efflux transporter [Pirellulaceae bacterium]|nr:chromate efflux transporter [Pirellulaceae bacterium]